MPVRAMPVVQNFVGATNLGRDTIAGLGPITLGGFNGNFVNSSFVLDGVVVEGLAIEACEWMACEGGRVATLGDSTVIRNSVRMGFEERVIIQKWVVNKSITSGTSVISLFLDGPFFTSCDEKSRAGTTSCGWGLSLPTNRTRFANAVSLSTGVMSAIDTQSSSAAASIVVPGGGCSKQFPPPLLRPDKTFEATVECEGEAFEIYHVIAVASQLSDAMDLIKNYLPSEPQALSFLTSSFESSCSLWQERWEDAFSPSTSYFSGNLPTLVSASDPALSKLYYWAALSLVSLSRVSMLSFPVQFVISEGASNSYSGDSGMGGAGQFLWDLSFSAASLSLLEPMGTKAILTHVVANADFAKNPIGVPQAWDAFPEYPNLVDGGQYCFDFVAAFIYVQSYVSLSGDRAFLTQPIPNNHDPANSYTPLEFLQRISTNWQSYPRSAESPHLVDYGSDKRNFLEAAATYTNVIPALQLSNAGMLLALSKVLDDEPSYSTKATEIVLAALEYQYVREDGSWKCLKQDGGGEPTQVKAISDFIYISLSLGLMNGDDGIALLPEQVRRKMVDLFESDFQANGWVRAISLNDPSMANINCLDSCSDDDLVSMRSDWSATGAYGGLAGASIDALVSLSVGDVFSSALRSLRNISSVADSHHGTMPAQGVAVTTPPYMIMFLQNNSGIPTPDFAYAPNFPEFFDEQEQKEGFPASWPSTSRSIQNAEASIVDAFVRSVFGWRPGWGSGLVDVATTEKEAAAIDACLYKVDLPRGDFEGQLKNVRTPFNGGRLIDISVGVGGVSWEYSGTST